MAEGRVAARCFSESERVQENGQKLETKLKKPESCRCNVGKHSEVLEKCHQRNASSGGEQWVVATSRKNGKWNIYT